MAGCGPGATGDDFPGPIGNGVAGGAAVIGDAVEGFE